MKLALLLLCALLPYYALARPQDQAELVEPAKEEEPVEPQEEPESPEAAVNEEETALVPRPSVDEGPKKVIEFGPNGIQILEVSPDGTITIGDTIIATAKCNRKEFQDYIDDYGECVITSQKLIALILLTENERDDSAFKKATCQGWAESIDCMEAQAPNCFEGEKIQERINNVRAKYIEKADNFTHVLGETFIEECEQLNQDRIKLMEFLTGSTDKCTYSEFKRAEKLFGLCMDDLISDRRLLTDKTNVIDDLNLRRELYTVAECRAYQRFQSECVPLQAVCLSDEKHEKLKSLFKERELVIHKSGIFDAGFSFEHTCSNGFEERIARLRTEWGM